MICLFKSSPLSSFFLLLPFFHFSALFILFEAGRGKCDDLIRLGNDDYSNYS